MPESPATRVAWTAYAVARAPLERRAPFRSPAALERTQHRRVRKAVAHAYEHVPYYRETMDRLGLGPADIQTAVLYDHFTPFVLTQLEELGFCDRGEAKDYVADGGIELGGRLPVNTHGGQLGEAYLHGMNGVAEAVRQIRGTSPNQLPGVEHVLVTAGTGVPTSGLILERAA